MTHLKFSNKFDFQEDFLKEDFASRFSKNSPVVIKMHFGEPGNPNAFTKEDVKPLLKILTDLGLETLLVDTPVTYHSPRDSKIGYEKVVVKHGFDQLSKFLIEDEYVIQKVGGLDFEVAKVLAESKNLIVLSHVKGHECAGFGGAIKNLGMGALSAKSKSFIHDSAKPVLEENLCVGCGTCANLCPAKAIEIKNGKMTVDYDKCYGCSICQIQCPHLALKPKLKIFDEALAMGAMSAVKLMPKNTFYINVIKKVVQFCDCSNCDSPKLAEDVGVLYGDNPVAIDQASIDLIKKSAGNDVFKIANHKDPYLQIAYASQYSGLSREYDSTEVS